MTATKTKLDPVTIEVIRNALPAISNEMSNTVQHAAYSQFIYEVKDYCVGIYDTEGRIWSQGIGGVAMFLAGLGLVPSDGIRHFGRDNIHPGDVFIHNHQRLQGSHLNHINIWTPFFFDGELLACPTVRAHHVDVGGAGGAGGLPVDSWAEGLQIDHLKLYDRGVADETAIRLIRDNVRMPENTMGDIRAEIAACRLAERRLEEIFRRYGKDAVLASLEEIYAQTEARCRAEVEKIPDGTYEAESWFDSDKFDLDTMIPLRAKVIVKGSDMTIDLNGCSPQVRGMINSRTLAAPYVAYKALTTPTDHVNEGSFRALKVDMREGTVMMASWPANYRQWSWILATVVDTIFIALAPALPEKMPAGSQGMTGGGGGGGGLLYTDPVTKRPVQTSGGGGGGAGWGAHADRDGISSQNAITQGDVRNTPIEATENKYPMRIEQRALRADSGGPGKFRGGLGGVGITTGLIDGYYQGNVSNIGRQKFPPQGLFGGRPGAIVGYEVRRPGMSDFVKYEGGRHYEKAGTQIRGFGSGGGGWGDPLDRDPERVLADVIDEYVSAEGARRDYGVVLKRSDTMVDEEATMRLRTALREGRPR